MREESFSPNSISSNSIILRLGCEFFLTLLKIIAILFHAMSNYRVGNAREGRLEFLKQFHTLNVVIWSKFSHIVSDNHSIAPRLFFVFSSAPSVIG